MGGQPSDPSADCLNHSNAVEFRLGNSRKGDAAGGMPSDNSGAAASWTLAMHLVLGCTVTVAKGPGWGSRLTAQRAALLGCSVADLVGLSPEAEAEHAGQGPLAS
jgi:hypothetical protein